MKNNKKGGATLYLILIGAILLVVAAVFIKFNWRRFKAEAGFAFSVIAFAIVILLVLYLLIRHSIRKARKEKEKEKARLEKEKRDAEIIAAGGTPSTLGNGKFEMSDVSETAGKAKDKIGGLFSKEDQDE